MIIECTYGPVSTEVMGTTYTFAPDEYGRAVAEVWNQKHIDSFLAVVHYKAVKRNPDDPNEPDPNPVPEPEPEPEPEAATAAVEEETEVEVEDVTTPIPVTAINGIGAALAGRLAEAGISDARQLAALSAEEAEELDEKLGLGGRVARDKWVEQAKALEA